MLALLSYIGKANVASAAASIWLSYRALKLALLARIYGGVPYGKNEIILGDIIISKTII